MQALFDFLSEKNLYIEFTHADDGWMHVLVVENDEIFSGTYNKFTRKLANKILKSLKEYFEDRELEESIDD